MFRPYFAFLIFSAFIFAPLLPAAAQEENNFPTSMGAPSPFADPFADTTYGKKDFSAGSVDYKSIMTEPEFSKVTFLKVEEPKTLQDRTDFLLYGIYVDTPPAYDHYGYEIRRYMTSIGDAEIMKNEERLRQELHNINVAKIIFQHWRKKLIADIKFIEEEIKRTDASSQIRTTYRYNAGIVRSFLLEGRTWLDDNEAILQMLVDKRGEYSYDQRSQTIIFDELEDLNKFTALHKIRVNSLTVMNEYTPFMMMVY